MEQAVPLPNILDWLNDEEKTLIKTNGERKYISVSIINASYRPFMVNWGH